MNATDTDVLAVQVEGANAAEDPTNLQMGRAQIQGTTDSKPSWSPTDVRTLRGVTSELLPCENGYALAPLADKVVFDISLSVMVGGLPKYTNKLVHLTHQL